MQTKVFLVPPQRNINLLDVHDFYWSSPSITLAGIGVAKRIQVPNLKNISNEMDQFSEITLVNNEGDAASRSEELCGFAAFPFDPNSGTDVIIPSILIKKYASGKTYILYTGHDMRTEEDIFEQIFQNKRPEGDQSPTHVQVDYPIPPYIWRDEKVNTIKDYIKAGEVKKVVLARELVLAAKQDFQINEVLQKLQKQNQSSLIFNIDGFLGASPELLIKREGNTIMSHPLAGTTQKYDDLKQDQDSKQKLLESTKDAYEHKVTIDWLLNELLPFCSFVDADPEPKIISLSHVHHLGTEVSGQLSNPPCSILELVSSLHPTPAVGGDPQKEALAIIKEVEGINRQHYAGPVGWVAANGDGEFAVGIRSAEVISNRAHLFAGVGLVEDSDPQSELEETEAKFKTMLNTFLSTP